MKELIQVSLGTLSNYTSTHFWNFQDEWLKTEMERNPVLYYETPTGQYVPRSLFFDFRENFGNFQSVFTHEEEVTAQQAQAQWPGEVMLSKQDEIERSFFMRELIELDQNADDGAEEQKEPAQELDEYDEYERKQERMKKMMADYKAGKSGDMFMQMMMQEKQDYQEDKVKAEKVKAKKSDQPEKTPQEYYESFKFDESVNFFVDFMQSKMQKQNQVVLPSTQSYQENFAFFNQGRFLYKEEPYIRDDIEDQLRNQLEQSDLLEGFQFTCDTNSGFGSLAQLLIQEFIKDEAPKAPIVLYSLKNESLLKPIENQQLEGSMRQQLEQLNSGFWLSELSQICDLTIPVDLIEVGETLGQKYLRDYKAQNVFHRSAVLAQLIDNIICPTYSKKDHQSLQELISLIKYSDHGYNIATAQMQFPYLVSKSQHLVGDLVQDQITKRTFQINFNAARKQKVSPMRQTFILRGLDNILEDQSDFEKDSIGTLKNQFELSMHKLCPSQRGTFSRFISKPNVLPIPFPRFFTQNQFSATGLLKDDGFGSNDFVYTMPTLTHTSYDCSYLNQIKDSISQIKDMRAVVKIQIAKDYMVEESELREAREILENMYEGCKALDCRESDSDEDDVHSDESM